MKRQEFAIQEKRSALAEYGPMGFGGVMLVLAFAFAGHYMGQNAVAHNADPGDVLEVVAAPSSNILAKGSLMPEASPLEPPTVRSPPPRPSPRPARVTSSSKSRKRRKKRSSSFRLP